MGEGLSSGASLLWRAEGGHASSKEGISSQFRIRPHGRGLAVCVALEGPQGSRMALVRDAWAGSGAGSPSC